MKLVPNKVHIRGLDMIDQNQLRTYLSHHIGGKGADRIEWVNDTSANLVFASDAAAQEALVALCAVEIADPTQLTPSEVLPAKLLPEKPEVALQVRFAVESDRKERGAAQKSRFYLFHPEWDPETEEGRRKRESYRNKRYRDRDDHRLESSNRRNSARGRYDDRFRDEAPDEFDVNLYDDDAGALSRRVRDSPRRDQGRRRDSRSSSDHSERPRHTNRDRELFPNSRPKEPLRSERGTHTRDRSASPARDDRSAMEDDLAKDREAMRSNREKARSIKERIHTKGGGSGTRELFPGGSGGKKELFPADTKKELFPDRAAGRGGAQMDSVLEGMRSLSYDGAVDFPDGRYTPFSSSSSPSSTSSPVGSRRLPRGGGYNCTWSQVPLTYHATDTNVNAGGMLSIRGTSRQGGGMMTIKGSAKSVKELFPNKFSGDSHVTSSNNSGRELFADKAEGRGRRRQRAEDLFH